MRILSMAVSSCLFFLSGNMLATSPSEYLPALKTSLLATNIDAAIVGEAVDFTSSLFSAIDGKAEIVNSPARVDLSVTSPLAYAYGTVEWSSHLPYDFYFRAQLENQAHTFKVAYIVEDKGSIALEFSGFLTAEHYTLRASDEKGKEDLRKEFCNGFSALPRFLSPLATKGLNTAESTPVIKFDRMIFFKKKNTVLVYAKLFDSTKDDSSITLIRLAEKVQGWAKSAVSFGLLLSHYWEPKKVSAADAQLINKLFRPKSLEGRTQWVGH